MPARRPSRLSSRLALATLLALPLLAVAATAQTTYQKPSKALVDIVDAPTTPLFSLGPDERWAVLMDVPGLPALAELAEPELRLAGLRIRPTTFGPSRDVTYTGLRLLRIVDTSERAVEGLPASSPDEPLRIDNLRWSADSRHVAFTLLRGERIEPWLLDVASAKARRLADVRLSLVANEAPVWLPDSSGLLAALVPDDLGAAPEAPAVPAGPVIEETAGRTAPARTYQDLLESPHDEALFAHYFTAQLARIDLEGNVTRIGAPHILWSFSPSPSADYVLVESIHRPFSYQVPAFRFPRTIEVFDRAGRPVHRLVDLPLQEEVPMAFGSVPTGPRSVQWRADAPATLVWVEALDGGDARVEATERDRVLTLAAPFGGDPVPLATLDLRYGGVLWGDEDLALIYSSWWQNREEKILRVVPEDPAGAAVMVDRSYEDRYGDPGTPETRFNAAGRSVLLTAADGHSIYMIGDGASAEGDRPFLDLYDTRTGETRRLFHSEGEVYEHPMQVLSRGPAGSHVVLTRRESPTEPPNYFLRDLDSGALRQLTHFPHPTPQLRGIGKELIHYRRADGVDLTATLYTPPGYQTAQGPLPMLMWAYPIEFKSADAAGQVRDSPYRFDRISYWSPLLWLAAGYAVLDDPAMPIVGEGDAEPNDTYVEQLVASAQAAVDEVVRRGVTAPGMIAIGGHSYGAFMTANLLAHSDLFAAGIARSGAYNRTLTPFGFQSEERSVWEKPEIYFTMSPFLHADKIKKPILLIHGQLDNNSGTFPMQSERFYAALKGLGGTARLVLLPYESHGYRARESILHMLWEQEQWLGRWLHTDTRGATGSR